MAASTTPPVIEFLPRPQSDSTGNAADTLPVVQTNYGTPVNNTISPCTSGNSTKGCGAVALDSMGIDISQRIVAVDVTPCPVNQTCPGCDIDSANAGLCPPGNYLFSFRCISSLQSPCLHYLAVLLGVLPGMRGQETLFCYGIYRLFTSNES